MIALGCVIQGDTRHFDFICQGVTQGITQLQIQWNMPIAFGVLTVNDMQQALDRCGGRHGNKGCLLYTSGCVFYLIITALTSRTPERRLISSLSASRW